MRRNPVATIVSSDSPLVSTAGADLAPVTATDVVPAALASRMLIEQAKGVLIERYKVTAAGAFDMLVRVSSINGIEVRDLAERLVRTGEFPGYEFPLHRPRPIFR